MFPRFVPIVLLALLLAPGALLLAPGAVRAAAIDPPRASEDATGIFLRADAARATPALPGGAVEDVGVWFDERPAPPAEPKVVHHELRSLDYRQGSFEDRMAGAGQGLADDGLSPWALLADAWILIAVPALLWMPAVRHRRMRRRQTRRPAEAPREALPVSGYAVPT